MPAARLCFANLAAVRLAVAWALSLAFALPCAAETVKLSTWNLNWFSVHPARDDIPPDAPHRTHADIVSLRAYADHLNADIVALQEVDGTASAAALFPPERYTLLNIHQNVAQRVGLAVRRPIAARQNPDVVALDTEPVAATHRLRYGLDATLTFPTGAVLRLLVVHLKTGCITDRMATSRRPSCALLSQQIPPLTAWLSARAADSVPFAVLGDFNRDFDQPETMLTTLRQSAPLLRVTEGSSDPCWSGGPFIDHILLGGPARAWLVPASLRVMTYATRNPADRNRLSDHCAVSVRLAPQ